MEILYDVVLKAITIGLVYYFIVILVFILLVRTALAHIRKKRYKKQLISEIRTEHYDTSPRELLQLVKSEGILIKKMKKGDESFLDAPSNKYKNYKGIVIDRDTYGKAKHVYTVYEDFDGSIKYFDYPQ